MQYFQTTILKQMKDYPGMFFKDPCFPALSNYYLGVIHTLLGTNPGLMYSELVGFDDWLVKEYNTTPASFGWFQIISERVVGDREQISAFVDLYLRYRQQVKIMPEHF